VSELKVEIDRFRLWADAQPGRFGEWECDYPDWGPLYEAVLLFVTTQPFQKWSTVELNAVLYAVARDNECQHLAWEIRHNPELLLSLAKAAADCGEPDAKWQLAEELGQLGQGGREVELVLLTLASDADEYVRRRSLQALARLRSPAVEQLALAEWHRPDEHQQWVRMNVLWCLHRVGSSLLEPLLLEAERDDRPYLCAYAKRVRQGKVDD
jgi:hypothetical protein